MLPAQLAQSPLLKHHCSIEQCLEIPVELASVHRPLSWCWNPNCSQAESDWLSVSQVVFVATANQLQDMSRPLLDRLEIIQLSGYTLEEKEHIAQVGYNSILDATPYSGGITPMRQHDR